MKKLSATATVFIIACAMLLLFSTMSYALSPVADPAATPQVLGFTPTPRPPDTGVASSSTGGPPSIPEPMTIILTGLGLAGLAGYAHRRRKNNDDSQD